MKTLHLLLCLCICTFLSAQKDPIKWGKVSQAEADLQKVEYDSSATAVVLCDYGRVYAIMGDGVILRRHKRIKILGEDEKSRANIAISYHHESNETVTDFSAQTINIIDGKPVKNEIKKKEFFKVKIDDSWSELRFTFPDVQVGSIIEYTYSLRSKNYTNLESWYFQSRLPTLKSSIFASIGSGLNYNIMYQGRNLIQKYGNKSVNVWELDNLPAIKDEPFCPNPFDFTEKLKFQLSSYLSNGGYVDNMGSWKSVAKDLYDGAGLRQYLSKNKDAKSLINDIVSKEETPKVKIQKVYDYVVNNYTWNGDYSMFTDSDYKTFKSKTIGNSCEINLFFINLLQSAGLEALPALISTKRHGYVAKDITFYAQFNQLVACVKLDGKDLLIDATNPYRPYTLLDKEDLNREALVLNKKEPYWVPIVPYKKTKNIKLITMEIPEPGIVKYKFEYNATGYKAVSAREDFEEYDKSIEDFFNKNLIKENSEYKISDTKTKEEGKMNKAFYLSAEIIDKTLSVVNEDFIYVSPFVDRYLSSNPFNNKERYLPVDFYHPVEETYILNFKIPDGYEVVEMPEPINLITKGNKGALKFSSTQVNGQITMRITFSIQDPFFTPLEYPVLREIYDRYIEKREEQIVLKKKAS